MFWFFMVPLGTICGRDNSYTQDFHKFSYFGEVFWGLSISFFDASKYLIIINSLQKLLSKIQLLLSN